jgi:hypothetical protein
MYDCNFEPLPKLLLVVWRGFRMYGESIRAILYSTTKFGFAKELYEVCYQTNRTALKKNLTVHYAGKLLL